MPNERTNLFLERFHLSYLWQGLSAAKSVFIAANGAVLFGVMQSRAGKFQCCMGQWWRRRWLGRDISSH